LDNWSKIEFIFSHKLHISPIDLRKLEFYTIENLLKEYEDYVEQENKQYEKQQREYDKQQKAQQAQQPNFGGFKVPKIDMPKLEVPKF
jgi:sortase (surface protein transpeptidase)